MTRRRSEVEATPPCGLLNFVNNRKRTILFPVLASSQVDMTQERHSWMIWTVGRMTELVRARHYPKIARVAPTIFP